MIKYTDADKIVPGMKIRATGFRGEQHEAITLLRDYEVVSVHEGVFPDRPFVQVIDNTGTPGGLWHLSRFSFVETPNADNV